MRQGREFGSNSGYYYYYYYYYYYFLFKTKIVKHFVLCHVLSQSAQDGAPIITNQSTLRTAPELCKNVSLAVLFGTKSNAQTISTQMRVCVCACACIYIYIYIYKRVCVYVCMYMCVYIYIYIHTYTHILFTI